LSKLSLGKKDEACSDFKKALEMGDNDANSNYQKFCLQK